VQEFFELARERLAEQLDIDPEQIRMESRFDDLDADSIDVVEMMMALEDHYDIEFPEEEDNDYETFGALITALYEYLQQVKDV